MLLKADVSIEIKKKKNNIGRTSNTAKFTDLWEMNEGIRDINSNYFQEHFGSLVSSIASYNIAQTTVIYAKRNQVYHSRRKDL